MDALHIAVQKGLLKFEKGPFKKSYIPYLMLVELVHLHYSRRIRDSIPSVNKRRVSSKASGEQLETIEYSDSRTRGRFDSLCNHWIPSLNKEPSIPVKIDVTQQPFSIDFTWKPPSPIAVEAKNELTIADPEFSIPSAKPSACRLPVPGVFVGRDEERDTALANWRTDRKRPLLIWGTPSIGKSALALALLHHREIEKQFGTRRYQFRCDDLTSADHVKQQMAHKWLDIDPRQLVQSDIPQIERAIINELSVAPAACIIDNFETPHRADPVNSEEWLKVLLGIEGVWLIVTTQCFYKPGGIHWCKAVELLPLKSAFALDLFCAITDRDAHRRDPRLPSLLEDMAGVPHAIELLAHQAVNTDDLDSLIDRWAARGTLMLERMGGASRETSLADAYQFAIEQNPRVNEGCRRLLCAIACLPQGVHEADVPAISETLENPWDTADTLVNAALVYRESERLRILSPLRDYVLRTYPATQEELTMVRECYLDTARAGGAIGEPESARFFEELSEEFVNIEWAIEKSLALRDARGIDAACGLSRFSCASGLGGRDLLRCAQALAHDLGDRQAEAQCVFCSAQLAFYRVEYEDAWSGYQAALVACRAIDDRFSEALCLQQLGEIAARLRPDEARSLTLQALEAFQHFDELPGLWGQAQCRHNLAVQAMQRGDYHEALKQVYEALPIFRDTSDRNGEIKCGGVLGAIFCLLGDYERARAQFKEALAISQSLGTPINIAVCMRDLGQIEMECRRYAEASDYHQRALALFRAACHKPGEDECLNALAAINRRVDIGE